MKCDYCNKNITNEPYIDESGNYHIDCIKESMKQSALDAGIPLSVIEGKTKLTDHFSQEYIYLQCNKQNKYVGICGQLNK